ncbi:MAG: S-layer homology domain-containing protein [Desulfitobacteriaceae bacterium]|nr:S-layer homology domain-containing protein [Desulfitobacteriaceae bacterium]MDD4753655.1 S-layer homology domain-containing protein [Desulfitobacteriaceae bacterium]
MKNLKLVIILTLFLILNSNSVIADSEEYYTLSEPWVYTITHEVELSNPTQDIIRNVKVTIPLMDQDQPVYQELLGEEFNPWPEKILTNQAGARQGVFAIPVIYPGQKITLKQKYAVRNYAATFHISVGQVSPDYGTYQGIPDRYLKPETKIESDHPSIIKYAKEVVKDEKNPYIIAQKLFADINLFMTYKSDSPNANKGALNAIRTGEGVCEDYTNLFVAAARSLGIPARWKSGYLYLPREHNGFPYIREDGALDITLMRHTWPEFYLPQIGWVVLDPTFTYKIRSGKREEKVVDWNKFARIESSSRHIFFAYGSYDDDYIEYKYTGPKPQVKFSESMEFGKNIFPFRDAVNHWAKDSILYLTNYTPRIIGGYGNGLFGPNDKVTRAQLAAMLNRALLLNYNVSKPQFSDVSPGYWAYADIAAAKGAGIFGGYPDGTFKPEKYVSRAELVVILDRAFDLGYPAAGTNFKDLGKPGYAWADSSIITLAGNGVVAGYEGGYFYPERSVTRAEFTVFMSRVLDGAFRLPVR